MGIDICLIQGVNPYTNTFTSISQDR